MLSDLQELQDRSRHLHVLMRLMALGAFWPPTPKDHQPVPTPVLMHLMALGVFYPAIMLPSKKLSLLGLNAPYGARCFLTRSAGPDVREGCEVLMHLMALDAF